MSFHAEELRERVRALIAPRLPSDFRYTKGAAEFRDDFQGGSAYLAAHVTSRNGYGLGFYFGVRHDALERRILELLGSSARVERSARSIWYYSVNLGPRSMHWQHDVPGWWSLETESDWSACAPQVIQLVEEIVLPYLESHRDPAQIRRTLLDLPRRALNFHPYRQILGVDVLEENPARARADLEVLDARYESMAEAFRREYSSFRQLVGGYIQQP